MPGLKGALELFVRLSGDGVDTMSGADDTAIRVLLVDQDSSRIIAIRVLLARSADARFIVEEAGSLSAALRRLTRGDINIILLDSRLPDSDGLKAIVTLQSRFPDTPVIILTHSEDKRWAPNALQMGAKDCIVRDNIDSHLLGRIILRHAKKA